MVNAIWSWFGENRSWFITEGQNLGGNSVAAGGNQTGRTAERSTHGLLAGIRMRRRRHCRLWVLIVLFQRPVLVMHAFVNEHVGNDDNRHEHLYPRLSKEFVNPANILWWKSIARRCEWILIIASRREGSNKAKAENGIVQTNTDSNGAKCGKEH